MNMTVSVCVVVRAYEDAHMCCVCRHDRQKCKWLWAWACLCEHWMTHKAHQWSSWQTRVNLQTSWACLCDYRLTQGPFQSIVMADRDVIVSCPHDGKMLRIEARHTAEKIFFTVLAGDSVQEGRIHAGASNRGKSSHCSDSRSVFVAFCRALFGPLFICLFVGSSRHIYDIMYSMLWGFSYLLRCETIAVVQRWHFGMLNDTQRNEAYFRALKRALKGTSGLHVLDVGAGTGLLASKCPLLHEMVWAQQKEKAIEWMKESLDGFSVGQKRKETERLCKSFGCKSFGNVLVVDHSSSAKVVSIMSHAIRRISSVKYPNNDIVNHLCKVP